MSHRIAVGVVGTSWYADFMHLPALKSHSHADLVAICGRRRDRADEMAAKYEIPHVFTNYQEMIERGRVDALVVATPDDLHYPVTMAALSAGLHVLCEKPLALTMEHAQTMYERADEAGVTHMTYFTWRWFPPFQYLQRLINEGYLGQCYSCHFRFIGGYGRNGHYGWKWDRQRGLGILGDLGVHMIDMAQWLIGDIEKVTAHLPTFVERPGSDGQSIDPTNDSALLALKFTDGGQGSIYVSAVAHLGGRRHEIQILLHGEAGTLELEFTGGGGYVVRGARSDEEHITPFTIPQDILNGVNPDAPIGEQLHQVFTEQPVGSRLFIESILAKREVSPSFYDGLKAQQVIEAALEADRRECWVAV